MLKSDCFISAPFTLGGALPKENMDNLAELQTTEDAKKSRQSGSYKGEPTERNASINYELMLIFLSDLGEDGINKELEEIKKHITIDGGEILNEDSWGNRELTYRIKKQDQGFYYVLNFQLYPEKVAELQKGLTISPAIIRSLLIKAPTDYQFKTYTEYEALAKEASQKLVEAKKQVKKPTDMIQPRKKLEKKIIVKTEKIEKVQEETVKAEKKPKKIPPTSTKLEEVDAKLKSIIDDPDITL